jgi:tetratricopeptide (TPR) repeat protein
MLTCKQPLQRGHLLHAAALAVLAGVPVAALQQPSPLDDAKRLFYNAQYRASAGMALEFSPSNSDEELARDELRTSALLFQIRGLLEPPDRSKSARTTAFERCGPCPELVAALTTDVAHGQQLARRRIEANANDETALFFLGKLNLSYVWLQLGPLHRRTGWHEYWEARRSLDAVLKLNPRHVRARVARAWIDYIVDTKLPWGTRWMLGGGDKKRALAVLREAAAADSDFFSHAEAVFGLWDMLLRERHVVEAIQVAEQLAAMFPGNPEVATFLEAKRQ